MDERANGQLNGQANGHGQPQRPERADRTDWADWAVRARAFMRRAMNEPGSPGPLEVLQARRSREPRDLRPLLGASHEAPKHEHEPRPSSRPLTDVIGDCAIYDQGHRRSGPLPLSDAARAARRKNGFVWIGLQNPTDDEVTAISAEFGLPALAVEDAIRAHQRPKLETYDDIVFAVLKPVTYIDHEEVISVAEIALFMGASFVVTVRHGDTDVLKRVRAELDGGDQELIAHGPSGVLYRAADLAVDGYEEAIGFINEDVDEIESQVFSGPDADDHSERIYKLKREVAEFRRAVQPLAGPMQRLVDGTVPGIEPSITQYFRNVQDHVLRASDAIDGHDRLLSDVLQAELARVSARQSAIAVRQSEIALEQNEIANRQNEDMRKISAWAAIALVPTAVAGIYGMNFHNMPELTWHYGYYGALGVITAACAGLYTLFRRNGWL